MKDGKHRGRLRVLSSADTVGEESLFRWRDIVQIGDAWIWSYICNSSCDPFYIDIPSSMDLGATVMITHEKMVRQTPKKKTQDGCCSGQRHTWALP